MISTIVCRNDRAIELGCGKKLQLGGSHWARCCICCTLTANFSVHLRRSRLHLTESSTHLGMSRLSSHFQQTKASERAPAAPRGKSHQSSKAAAGGKSSAAAAEAAGAATTSQSAAAAADEAALRQFDLSTRYGPCTGITRMQRWERAVKLGLSPPPEVPEIVQRNGGLDTDFNRDIFHHPF